jgi:hypothetical protein
VICIFASRESSIMNIYTKLIFRLQPNGRHLLQQQHKPINASVPLVRPFMEILQILFFSLACSFCKTSK